MRARASARACVHVRAFVRVCLCYYACVFAYVTSVYMIHDSFELHILPGD